MRMPIQSAARVYLHPAAATTPQAVSTGYLALPPAISGCCR